MQIDYFYSVRDGRGLMPWNFDLSLSDKEMIINIAESYFEHINNLCWPVEFKLYDSNRKHLVTHVVELSTVAVFSIANKE